jgi:hypothetical protein
MATGRQAKRTFQRDDDDDGVTDAQLLPRQISADVDDAYNPELEAAFEQLKEDFRTANSEGTLWVHRVPLDQATGDVISNGKNVFLFSAPIQRYSTEEIYSKVQREFMESMRVTCIRVSATRKGERGVRFNQLVMVESPARRDEKQPGETGGGVQLGSLGDIMRVIQEGQQQMLALMQRALQPLHAQPQPQGMQPQIDTLRSLAEIMFLIGGGTRAAPAQTSVLDQLKTLRELRGFVGELADDAPTNGGGDGPAAVLKHLSPWAGVFGQLLANQQPPAATPMRPGPAPRQIQPPAATVATAASPGIAPMTPLNAPQNATEGNNVLLFQKFRDDIETLTNAAEAGNAPTEVAPMVLAMIPEGSEQEAAFIAFLESAQWWQHVCALHPPATSHEAWFNTLRTAILAEFEDSGGDSGATLDGAADARGT